jgi:streptomycin 6-kinase
VNPQRITDAAGLVGRVSHSRQLQAIDPQPALGEAGQPALKHVLHRGAIHDGLELRQLRILRHCSILDHNRSLDKMKSISFILLFVVLICTWLRSKTLRAKADPESK